MIWLNTSQTLTWLQSHKRGLTPLNLDMTLWLLSPIRPWNNLNEEWTWPISNTTKHTVHWNNAWFSYNSWTQKRISTIVCMSFTLQQSSICSCSRTCLPLHLWFLTTPLGYSCFSGSWELSHTLLEILSLVLSISHIVWCHLVLSPVHTWPNWSLLYSATIIPLTQSRALL